MEQFSFTISKFQILIFIFFRIAGIIFMAPLLSSRNIPVAIKVLISFICSGLFYFLKDTLEIAYVETIAQLIIVILKELSIGFIIGFISQLIFTGIGFGGQLIGIQTGLSIAMVLDPQDNSHDSVFAVFLNILAVLIFLSINGHHWFFEAVFYSFKVLPLGGMHFSPKILFIVLESFNSIFIISIKIAAPIMGTILILDFIIGILSRMIPQIEVFILAFPLKIASGLFILGLSIEFISILIQRFFYVLPHRINNVINILAG